MSTARLPEVAVSVGLWQDRPPDEVLVTAAEDPGGVAMFAALADGGS